MKNRNAEAKQRYAEIDATTGIRLNRAKMLVSIHRSRAKQHGLPYTLTHEEWIEKLIASNGCCSYCGRNIGINSLILEHIVSIADGGGTTRENVTPACKSCDAKKMTAQLTTDANKISIMPFVRSDDQLVAMIEHLVTNESDDPCILERIVMIVRAHRQQAKD